MTDELNEIFKTIKGWSFEEIRSIFYHEKWTWGDGTVPFANAGKSRIPPDAHDPESFRNLRESLTKIAELGLNNLDAEQNAKIIICSTFLLMNDHSEFRYANLKTVLSREEVKSKLLELLDKMDSTHHSSVRSIHKLQLFYALLKQNENPEFSIKKVTWKNVTSKWGPKIVMSDDQSYYYVFNQFAEFETFQKNYNIAAKLGQTEQYESEYLEHKNDFNLRILKVLGTKDCMTLADYFKKEKMGEFKSESNTKLFERLAEMFFKSELDQSLTVTPEELKKILPRLQQHENNNPCLNQILHQNEEWKIPRRRVKTGDKVYYVVHGDEWGGNFLVTTPHADAVYVIDFEDAIFSDANNPETVVRVGGDLSSRIFSSSKDENQKFLPIGLSVFASIGRLLAAIVQYHARHGELEKDNIKVVIQSYLDNFENALEKRQLILQRDHWGEELEKLILLHAWDWALYWKQKGSSIFPTKHFDEFIQQIKKFLGCNKASTDPEDGNSSINRQVSKFSESQYNLFEGGLFNFIPPYEGEITDKVFEVQLKTLKRTDDRTIKVKYVKENILRNSQENRELEYFSLLYIILNSDANEAKDYYVRIEEIADELSRNSSDIEYRYTSQLAIFWTVPKDQEHGKFYNNLVNISDGSDVNPGFYIFSRTLLSNYHMARGEYPVALDFNIEGGKLLSETPSNDEEVAQWYDLYTERCTLYHVSNEKEKISDIIPFIKSIFENAVMHLDENRLFCNSIQFYNLLGHLDEHVNQDIILEYFNRPEFMDELDEENLARLHTMNGLRFFQKNELGRAIRSYKLAESYANSPQLRSAALCTIGQTYSALGEYKQAISYVEQAIETHDIEIEYWAVFSQLANWNYKLMDYSKAMKYLKKSSKVNHKLYQKNSRPDHFYQYLHAVKLEFKLGEILFKDEYNPVAVYSKFRQLLKEGIRAFKRTPFEDPDCEGIFDELLEISTSCSEIDPLFSSSQSARIQREWKRKQNSDKNQKVGVE